MNVHEAIPTLADLLDLPVHPMADRFPMWPPDRLAELAADIQANGLNIPIVIWRREMMLLDGRNRRAACALISHEPEIEWWDGEDPRSLIISRNIQTREMSASQKAMILAAEFPNTRQGQRNDLTSQEGWEVSFSKELLRQARQIVRWASDEIDAVISGATRFDAALKIATDNRQKASSREARMERLTQGAPDLAQKMADGVLALDEAEAVWCQRQDLAASAVAAGKEALGRVATISLAVSLVSAARVHERIPITAGLVAEIEAAAAALRSMMEEQ